MTFRTMVKPYGQQFILKTSLYDPDTPQDFATGLSFVAGDVKISQDGSAFVNTTNLPSEIGSTGVYTLTLTAAEMQAEDIVIAFVDQTATKAWMDLAVLIEATAWRTSTNEIQIWEIDDTGAAPTATSFEAMIIMGTERTAVDAYKDRQIIFISGAEAGSVAFIESSDAGVSSRAFTVTQIPTGAPSDGEQFVII